jgi:hypothetical protein
MSRTNPDLTAEELSLRGRKAAHTRWAKTDHAEASEAARLRLLDRFDREVDPDGTLEPAERARRSSHALKAHMAGLALKSSKARRLAKKAS